MHGLMVTKMKATILQQEERIAELERINEVWRKDFAKLEAQNKRLEQTIEEYDELYDSLKGILSGAEIREKPNPGPRKTERHRYIDCLNRIIIGEE